MFDNDDDFASKRMKRWMEEHGWSTLFSRDPADILELLQEHGDDADFDFFSIQIDN